MAVFVSYGFCYKGLQMGGFEQQKFIVAQFWKPAFKIKVSARLVPSGGSERESVPGLSPSLLLVLASILSVSCLVDGSLQALPPSLRHSPLCVSLSKFPYTYEDISQCLRATLIQSGHPHFNWITSTKMLFPYKVTCTGTGVRT